jgi:hypothetical protein
MAGWNELALQPEVSRERISPENLAELLNVLDAEDDDAVILRALINLARLSRETRMEVTEWAEDPLARNSLLQWFWEPFAENAGVFYAADSQFHHRDVAAVVTLARRLGFDRFGGTNIHPVPVTEPDAWIKIAADRGYKSICLIGRLWLFGETAESKLKPAGMRFSFPQDVRPAGLKAGQLDPNYHQICEQIEGRQTQLYTTRDNGQQRVDYGLVQRYEAKIGVRPVTVVLCAGCSSYGTIGAAIWAARELALPQNINTDAPIGTPPQTTTGSRMEALIETTMQKDSGTWQPTNIELMRLLVADHQWCAEKGEWDRIDPHIVQVRLHEDTLVDLNIDGQPGRVRSGTQTSRLLAAVLRGIHESPSDSVAVESLANDSSIWGGRTMKTKTAKQRLHTVDERHLGRLMTIDDEVRLNAELRIIDE